MLVFSHRHKDSSGLERYKERRTEDTELAATIVACVLELTEVSNIIKWSNLFDVFYNWHDKKRDLPKIK